MMKQLSEFISVMSQTCARNLTVPVTAISSRAAVRRPCTVAGFILPDGSVAEWLACWTQAQKGLGSNRSHDAVR